VSDEEGKKSDGSRRFQLVGGKHDAHGKKKKTGGFHLRIYPHTYAKQVAADRWTPAEFDDEIEFDGEVYSLDPQARIATFVRKV
jgi:hypothetical protein